MENPELAGVGGEAMLVVSRGCLGLEKGARPKSILLAGYRLGTGVLTCST